MFYSKVDNPFSRGDRQSFADLDVPPGVPKADDCDNDGVPDDPDEFVEGIINFNL